GVAGSSPQLLAPGVHRPHRTGEPRRTQVVAHVGGPAPGAVAGADDGDAARGEEPEHTGRGVCAQDFCPGVYVPCPGRYLPPRNCSMPSLIHDPSSIAVSSRTFALA